MAGTKNLVFLTVGTEQELAYIDGVMSDTNANTNTRKRVELPKCYYRFYNTPPDEMTLEMCRYHGGAHRAYEWGKKLDHRWNEEQTRAYIEGYFENDKETLDPNVEIVRITATTKFDVPPSEATLEICANYGAEYRENGWFPHVDSRWNLEQVNAFRVAYGWLPLTEGGK
jgi:hypothetical protein